MALETGHEEEWHNGCGGEDNRRPVVYIWAMTNGYVQHA